MRTPSSSSTLVTPIEMRHVLAGVPTGVVLVAAEIEGRIVGLSANSFTSVSLDPPLVSISFAHTSTSWPVLRNASRWGVSVLGEEHREVLSQLRLPAHERFERLAMHVEAEAAFLDGALASLTVELNAEIEAGDHVLTLLRVLALDRDRDRRPLIFFDGGTHRLGN